MPVLPAEDLDLGDYFKAAFRMAFPTQMTTEGQIAVTQRPTIDYPVSSEQYVQAGKTALGTLGAAQPGSGSAGENMAEMFRVLWQNRGLIEQTQKADREALRQKQIDEGAVPAGKVNGVEILTQPQSWFDERGMSGAYYSGSNTILVPDKRGPNGELIVSGETLAHEAQHSGMARATGGRAFEGYIAPSSSVQGYRNQPTEVLARGTGERMVQRAPVDRTELEAFANEKIDPLWAKLLEKDLPPEERKFYSRQLVELKKQYEALKAEYDQKVVSAPVYLGPSKELTDMNALLQNLYGGF